MNNVHEMATQEDTPMFTAAKFDKTLIMMINTVSFVIACGMLLALLHKVVDMPDLSNSYWGFGTLADRVLHHYAHTGF